ncbi:histidine phosphatase family protein [Paraclostridium sordellii]
MGYIANTRGIDIVEKEGFKEINFGDFEGMNFNYIQKKLS